MYKLMRPEYAGCQNKNICGTVFNNNCPTDAKSAALWPGPMERSIACSVCTVDEMQRKKD